MEAIFDLVNQIFYLTKNLQQKFVNKNEKNQQQKISKCLMKINGKQIFDKIICF